MMLPILFCSLAAFFLIAHLLTITVAWLRCRPATGGIPDGCDLPPVTVVRPLCGLETFSAETLDASFSIDYPAFELIFCVAREADPIVPLVRTAIAVHPDVSARLLIGDDVISINPKLNNMVKGWRDASYPWIAFIDSNVLVSPDVVRQLVATWTAGTGAVAAPPAACRARGFGAYFECAFLNTYEARWQYFVDTFGKGFAQGKTLFYRKADLDRSGLRDLAAEPAEDAATTKMVRRMGLRVRLAPPSPMPIGTRRVREVWGRQLRWARLRRVTFLWEFLPEILSGAFVPAVVVLAAAASLDAPTVPVLLAYFGIWYAAETALAAGCRWPLTWWSPSTFVLRDALMPALWVAALTGRSFTWKGVPVQMEPRRSRGREIEANAFRSEEGF